MRKYMLAIGVGLLTTVAVAATVITNNGPGDKHKKKHSCCQKATKSTCDTKECPKSKCTHSL